MSATVPGRAGLWLTGVTVPVPQPLPRHPSAQGPEPADDPAARPAEYAANACDHRLQARPRPVSCGHDEAHQPGEPSQAHQCGFAALEYIDNDQGGDRTHRDIGRDCGSDVMMIQQREGPNLAHPSEQLGDGEERQCGPAGQRAEPAAENAQGRKTGQAAEQRASRHPQHVLEQNEKQSRWKEKHIRYAPSPEAPMARWVRSRHDVHRSIGTHSNVYQGLSLPLNSTSGRLLIEKLSLSRRRRQQWLPSRRDSCASPSLVALGDAKQ